MNNSAQHSGVLLLHHPYNIQLLSSNFIGNNATKYDGGVLGIFWSNKLHHTDIKIYIFNCSFLNNSAVMGVGGVFIFLTDGEEQHY